MHLFLEKDDEIRLVIVKQFSNAVNQWLTRSELSKLVGVSQKKVSTLINSINDDLANVYDEKVYAIESCSGKGYCLKEGPATFKKLEIYYFNRSLAFLFIKKILFDQKKSTIEFCIENYTSLATLNRKLRRITPILNVYDLKLNVSKGQLQGKEVRIRQFYYEVLKNIYGTYEWPIKVVEKTILDQQIEQLNIETKSEFSFVERYIMEIYLAIAIIRIRQHHYVDSDFAEYNWLTNHPLYGIVHHFVNLQFKQLNDTVSDLETEYLIFLFITSMRIDRSESAVKKEIAFFKDNNIREYMLVKRLQNNLIAHYENEKQLKAEQLAYILTRRVILLENFGHIDDIQEMEAYLNKQQDKYPKFYNFIKEAVFKQMSGDLNFYQMEQLLTEIIPILKVNIPVVEYENPIKIGLFYETGTAQQYIAQSKIVEQINKKVVFETNEQNLENMDIIIVDEKNFQGIKEQVDPDVPIISFDNVFNDNSVNKLSNVIENMGR